MAVETKTEIASIPIIPEIPKLKVHKKTTWSYQDILNQKPRASIKKIEEAHKIVKIFESIKRNRNKKTKISYSIRKMQKTKSRLYL